MTPSPNRPTPAGQEGGAGLSRRAMGLAAIAATLGLFRPARDSVMSIINSLQSPLSPSQKQKILDSVPEEIAKIASRYRTAAPEEILPLIDSIQNNPQQHDLTPEKLQEMYKKSLEVVEAGLKKVRSEKNDPFLGTVDPDSVKQAFVNQLWNWFEEKLPPKKLSMTVPALED